MQSTSCEMPGCKNHKLESRLLREISATWNMQMMPFQWQKADPWNWCFWIWIVKKTLESPLDSREIKPVNPKGNQPWIFIGRTDAETEAPILWPADENGQLRLWCWEVLKEKGEGIAQKETVNQSYHQLNGHKFEQTLQNSVGPRSLACFISWGPK